MAREAANDAANVASHSHLGQIAHEGRICARRTRPSRVARRIRGLDRRHYAEWARRVHSRRHMKQTSLGFFLCITTSTLALAAPVLAQDRDGDGDRDRRVVVTRERVDSDVRASSPSGRFGLEGQKAVSSDAGLSISNTSVSGVDGSTTTLILRPAIDWFVADSLSLGGFVGVEYISAPSQTSSIISIGPRIGYNLPVSERVSFWPKLGFSLASTDIETDGVPGDDESNTGLQLNLFAPVMFHPVQHFFLGFGPALDQDLSGDAKATTIAARLTIGGWL
jgi:hypothetical protein